MRTAHGERLFVVIGIPIDVARYRADAWLDDTPASGAAQRQGPLGSVDLCCRTTSLCV